MAIEEAGLRPDAIAGVSARGIFLFRPQRAYVDSYQCFALIPQNPSRVIAQHASVDIVHPALMAIEEAGLRPDAIAGVSAGSVVAVLYAGGVEPAMQAPESEPTRRT